MTTSPILVMHVMPQLWKMIVLIKLHIKCPPTPVLTVTQPCTVSASGSFLWSNSAVVPVRAGW